MAKIDVTTIEGYENMTPEEKVAALEAVEFDDGSAEIARYKNAATKANSDAAESKRKYNALLKENGQQKQASDDELADLRAKVERMEKEKLIAEHKGQLLSMGYDDVLASATAQALADGDMATVFANQKIFLTTHDKAMKANLLKQTPTPPAGSGGMGGGTADYAKLIADAQTRGDFSAVAYYTRLSQEEKNK